MKHILLLLIIFYSAYSYGSSVTVSGNIKDMNNVPITNHWVTVQIEDTVTLYTIIDSVQTNQQGNYSYSVSNVGITQTIFIFIRTRDCVGTVHSLMPTYPGGSGYDFQICGGANPPNCDAQFTFSEDPVNSGTYNFVNQSTNNATNIWRINGNIVSQQSNFSHTFNTTPSTNNVCLEIVNSNQSCTDTKCSTVVVNYCSASFVYNVSGMSVQFTASASPNANYYVWDFGDGNSQTTNNAVIQYNYLSANSYNVVLTAFKIYGQDTCSATDAHIVTVAQASPMGDLIGYVFVGNQYLDNANIVLYTKNPSNGKLIAVDTTILQTDNNTSSTYYRFNNLSYGDYYVRCSIDSISMYYNEYIDTWASQNANTQIVHWQAAEAQSLNSQQQIANINLKKADVLFSGGTASVSGKIINTVGIDASDQLLFLLNHNYKIVRAIHPQPNGNFLFDTLIFGTYFLRPELTNYNSLDYQLSLNSAIPVVDNVIISVDSNHYYTSVANIYADYDFNVYPNPVVDNLIIEIPSDYKYDDNVIIDIYNSVGVHIYSKRTIVQANSLLKLPFSERKNGLYIVTLTGSYGVVVKKIMKLDATN